MRIEGPEGVTREVWDSYPTALIIDRDQGVLPGFKLGLAKSGVKAMVTSDPTEAMKLFEALKPNAVVISDNTGLVPADFKEINPRVAVIMTTDVVDYDLNDSMAEWALNRLGADGLLRKPVNPRYLSSSIRVILPRMSSAEPQRGIKFAFGNIEGDFSTFELKKNGQEVNLSPKEWGLLRLLVENPGIVFTREQIIDRVWNQRDLPNIRTIDVHVWWLRGKIEDDPTDPQMIKTVREVGYKFVPPGGASDIPLDSSLKIA